MGCLQRDGAVVNGVRGRVARGLYRKVEVFGCAVLGVEWVCRGMRVGAAELPLRGRHCWVYVFGVIMCAAWGTPGWRQTHACESVLQRSGETGGRLKKD